MKTDVKKLERGDFVSRISFMQVTSMGLNDMIGVTNEDGFSWGISPGIIEEECYSTNVDSEEKLPKTAIAEILMSAKDAIIEVCFDKANGEERVLTGYVIGAEPVLGRTIAIDITIPKKMRTTKEWDERQRQVDHRTLKWLVYKNVKYIVE